MSLYCNRYRNADSLNYSHVSIQKKYILIRVADVNFDGNFSTISHVKNFSFLKMPSWLQAYQVNKPNATIEVGPSSFY